MQNLAKLTLVLLSLVVLFWPGIQHHWEVARDPYFVPFDAKQYIPAFFKFDPNDPIPTTYLKEYFLNAVCPPLYKASLILGARFADVRHFQLAMMYLTYGFFVGVMGRLGWLLGGAVLSFAVMAFTITAWIFVGLGFIGGAPRMYGYPLMAVVLYALVRDHPRALGLTAVLGALLYPIISVFAGFCLVGWLFLPLYAKDGIVSSWSLRQRLATLVLVGALSVTALVPLFRGSEAYGRRIVAADVVNYPESGADGNYRAYDQLPYQVFGKEWLSFYLGPLYSHGDPIISALNIHHNTAGENSLYVLIGTGIIFMLVIFAGIRLLLKDISGMGYRLIGFFAVAIVLHVLAWMGAPYFYIPTRYFMFSLPFLITLVLPWSVYLLVHRTFEQTFSHRLRNTAFLSFVALYLAAFGGRGNVDFASATTVEKPLRPLFDKIATLPKDALIAGWPYGIIQNVEYISRRNVFLAADLHQTLHLNFTRVLRERMNAVFDAYLGTDAAPLNRLRREFGVTHILVDSRHFTDPKHAPEYFAPWRDAIKPRLDQIKNRAYLMRRSLHEEAALFNQNGLILLDLTKVPQS